MPRQQICWRPSRKPCRQASPSDHRPRRHLVGEPRHLGGENHPESVRAPVKGQVSSRRARHLFASRPACRRLESPLNIGFGIGPAETQIRVVFELTSIGLASTTDKDLAISAKLSACQTADSRVWETDQRSPPTMRARSAPMAISGLVDVGRKISGLSVLKLGFAG